MTTIAYKDGVLAADTQVTTGMSTKVGHVQKVHMIGEFLVGAAGRLADLDELLGFIESGEQVLPEGLAPDLIAIIVDRDKNVLIFENGKIMQFDSDYYALGSGEPFAMAAMHLKHDAKTAVETAMALDVFSGGDLQYATVDDLREALEQEAVQALAAPEKKKKKKCKRKKDR